jgi:hypothetical protein
MVGVRGLRCARQCASPAIVLFATLLISSVHAPALAEIGASSSPQESAAAAYYESVAIGRPANDATIFDNDGNIEVVLLVSPALRPGDRTVLSIDGHPMPPRSETRFTLLGLPRGKHTFQSWIVDASGKKLIASTPITFTLWQASRLFPDRRK